MEDNTKVLVAFSSCAIALRRGGSIFSTPSRFCWSQGVVDVLKKGQKRFHLVVGRGELDRTYQLKID